MDYFNKRGGVNFKVVALVMAIISFGVAMLIYAGVSEIVTENADFNCIVGNRLANMAGATSNPCRTTMATIEQLDFNKDLTIRYLECPQYKEEYLYIETLAKRCGEIKVMDKGMICWINYMSGQGNLQTASCYNLCMKPSYGSIEVKDSVGIIPLEFKGLKPEHLFIFEDDGFNAENPQHINQLIDLSESSKLSTLEVIETLNEESNTIEAIQYQRIGGGDVTIVIKIPFQDITVWDLAEVLENKITTTGMRRGEKYSDKLITDQFRMNTVSYEDQGFFDFDTNIAQGGTANPNEFIIQEHQSWLIQYIDSADWAPGASKISTWFDTDISDDSLNYAYNGVC
jgi:translation initiation factor 1 (eIF-1/SUI1)